MSWTTERAKVASLSRSRSDDDPELNDARRDLKAARLELAATDIATKADQYPPLTPAQRDAVLAAFAGFAPLAGGAS